MKKPVVLVAMVALLLATACAVSPTPTPTPEPGTLTYSNSEHGFSVGYPKDWTVQEEFMGTIVMFVGPVEEETGGAINVNIGATEAPEMTLEEYVRLFKLRIAEGAANYEELDEYDAVVDDLAAMVWTWKEDLEGTTLTLMVTMAVFMKEDVAYKISYLSTSESHDEYLDSFELALNTFKFD
jgi:hypothetical protein